MGSHISRVLIPPYLPLGQVIDRISHAFEEKGDTLSLLGFPKRVFCFRKPEHIMQILTHKSIGGIKFLPMMPRVKW
ncbi:MAG: hypothetical protein ABIP64_15915, partial [Burkholderiales bacterium]